MSIKKDRSSGQRPWKPIGIGREGWLGDKSIVIDGVETLLDSGTIV